MISEEKRSFLEINKYLQNFKQQKEQDPNTNFYIFLENDEIEMIFHTLKTENIINSLERLNYIAEHQVFNVSSRALSILFDVLNIKNNFSNFIYASALKLALELITFRKENITLFFSLPESIQIIWEFFPIIESTKILHNIMSQNPASIPVVLSIITFDKFQSILSIESPFFNTALFFYPKLLKASNTFDPNTKDFLLTLDTIILATQNTYLVTESISAMSEIIEISNEAATFLIERYPLYCEFDQTDSLRNIETIKLLITVAKSLQSYEFAANQKILEFLHLCLTSLLDYNDCLLFFTLDFFLLSKDLSPFYNFPFIFCDLISVIDKNKYGVQVKIIEIICHFYLANDLNFLENCFKLFPLENLVDFIDDDSNMELQGNILECLISIKMKFDQQMQIPIDELINDSRVLDIIDRISSKQENNLAEMAQFLLPKMTIL